MLEIITKTIYKKESTNQDSYVSYIPLKETFINWKNIFDFFINAWFKIEQFFDSTTDEYYYEISPLDEFQVLDLQKLLQEMNKFFNIENVNESLIMLENLQNLTFSDIHVTSQDFSNFDLPSIEGDNSVSTLLLKVIDYNISNSTFNL